MKRHLGSILMMSVALACALAFYVVSLKVSAERDAVDGLRGAIARDVADLRALEAELRTRARLPQLQRWNDEVLALAAPAPGQLLGDPLMVAAYGEPAVIASAPMIVAAMVGQVPPMASAPVARLAVASAGTMRAGVVAAPIGSALRREDAPAPAPAPVLAAKRPRVVVAAAPDAPREDALGDLIARELDAVAVASPARAALR